jgi:squalene synthase HpnC
MQNDILEQAYHYCVTQARSHYENFPVASWLLPATLRRATAVIYTFARRGDDIADEGDADAATRHRQLAIMRTALQDIETGNSVSDPLFIALADVVTQFQLPMQPLYDLLAAFATDIDKYCYADSAELREYCRLSANPIGQLVLSLHRQATPEYLSLSDSICTALQLINFLQDLDSDWRIRQRCYLPQEDMQALGISLADLTSRRNDAAMQQLIRQQLQRAAELLLAGAPLALRIPGRLGWELRATVASAWRIVEKLAIRTDIFQRPRLKSPDIPRIFFRTVFFRRHLRHASLIN